MLHRDPEVWGADAGAVRPGPLRRRRPYGPAPAHTFKPFGTGARACIGRQFALHEATLVLGLLLRRYDLRPDPAYRLRVTERLTLMPEGLRLHLERRPVPAGADAAADLRDGLRSSRRRGSLRPALSSARGG